MRQFYTPRVSPGVRLLIIINVGVYFLQMFIDLALSIGSSNAGNQFTSIFALHSLTVKEGFIWQIFTYQFLHDTPWPFHLLFNMFALYMFGSELENEWGKKRFIRYYLVCGTGAGFFIFLLPILFSEASAVTVGASGSILGLLLAYAIYWPNREVLVFFVIPVKIKYLVFFIGLFSMFMTLRSSEAWGISHAGHIGGLISGYLYLIYVVNSRSSDFSGTRLSTWNPVKRYSFWKQRKLWMKREEELFEMENMEAKVDYLLDKIRTSGYKSLTAKEKSFLKKASETMNIEEPSDEIH